jgi:DNA-binding transcriptional regulator LsrR (DeoR family)
MLLFVRRGKANARTLTRARVLLKSDEGWTDAEIAEALDISEQTIRWLVDEVYPEARVIRLVMDNLNTHTAASLYEAFPPQEAQRIWQRLEVHYTRHPWQLAQHG